MVDTRPSAFGTWLRHKRKLAGLTQEELAIRAGLTTRGVAAIERGRRRQPYPHTVRALAEALGLSMAERAEALAMIDGDGESDGVGGVSLPVQPVLLDRSPAGGLVGRDELLAQVLELIQEQQASLVTLTGPGGVGKTALSLDIARQVDASRPGSVVVIALEALEQSADLLAWIAARVGVTGPPQGAGRESLQGVFGSRRTLLVLDNFEHLLDAAPDVAWLIANNPGLQVLVTSRAPLRLRGEREVPVAPLAVPTFHHVPTPDEIRTAAAVQLFVARAQALSPAFAITQSNATAIAAICRRLDGLPLALELAAPRLRLLSPTELLARLDEVLPVLTGGARDLPERQRTIQQAIDWSYRLLGSSEQALFRRLSVFVGGWDLEAAEMIGSDPALSGEEPIEVLSALVEHALVAVDASDDHGTRYRMLETIRAFGRDQLAARGELEEAARAHAAWCLALAEQAASHDYGPAEADWLDRLERDHPNLRAALAHAVEAGDEPLLQGLVAALGRLWLRREYIGDDLGWREAVLRSVRRSAPTARGATVMFHVGRLAWERDARAEAIGLLRESMDCWTAAGDERGASGAMVILANMLRLEGAAVEADALLEAARIRLQEWGDEPFWSAMALRLLGIRAIERGDLAGAQRLLGDALMTARQSGYPWSVASALHNLGDVLRLSGQAAQAATLFGESLDISWSQRDRWSMTVTLPALAEVLATLGNAEWATRLFGAAEGLGVSMASRLVVTIPVEQQHVQRIEALRRELGEDRFDAAWREGQSLTGSEVIEEVRRLVAARPEPPAPMARDAVWPLGLSEREVEVIRLVAAGNSNAEAADQLYLSRRTVDAHLRRIYDKLDLRSRVELAQFAREQGFL